MIERGAHRCRPKPLELSAADEAIVRANLEVFRFNGFDCDIDDTAPAGRRVRLTAVPYSRSTSFSSRGPSPVRWSGGCGQGP